jgi:glutamate dehydrogenase (NADP+)
MRFCQSFMTELCRHIGPNIDVPAGDIGVGAREIGYMFGQYKRLTNKFEGILTGKGLEFGGSLIRAEATGYGAVYFLQCMLDQINGSLDGATVAISGSGNVATFAAEKCTQLGAKVLTMSDSSGYIHDPAGINTEKLEWIMQLKNVRRGRISEYLEEFPSATFHEGRPWGVACDYAIPCATQNEIDEDEARLLVKNGCKGISEGANMPTVVAGINVFQEAGILYGPSKAANAGGVAVSGMEMSQNSVRISWSEEELQKLLLETMQRIHQSCFRYGEGKGKDGHCDYLAGANIAGFVKVADAMLAYGVQ